MAAELERVNRELAAAQEAERIAAQTRLEKAAPAMLEALRRAEQKLAAYVGVCADDKELTQAVLPMVRAAIALAEPEPQP